MDVPLKCECGKVTGVAENVDGNLGNRLVCYCESCQKFAHHVGCADEVLDEYGGTDIFQMPISHLKFTGGTEHIRCVHVTEGGPYRWYTECCNTLIGNTGSPSLPFIGMIHSFMDDSGTRDQNLGPIRFHGFTEDAVSPLPLERQPSKWQVFRLIVRFLSLLLTWKLQGKGRPNPFFDEKGQPIVDGPTLSS